MAEQSNTFNDNPLSLFSIDDILAEIDRRIPNNILLRQGESFKADGKDNVHLKVHWRYSKKTLADHGGVAMLAMLYTLNTAMQLVLEGKIDNDNDRDKFPGGCSF